ncbi:maleylpyruvate isomerase N-terminal domain-containing protein [Actinoplanes sp. NPDC051411]|uniref:maleylpyruvate isomerase N-terminal domain-containing protein n=1 Tax=Actinoplanes sp. NPDC051411 TaxID=3155522 RepID=UPI00344A72DA
MPSRELSGALRSAAGRTAAVIRAAGEPGARVPGLDWTVAETAVHLVHEFGDYTAYAQGRKKVAESDQSPSRRNAVANAAQLREDPDRDLGSLADRLGPAVDGFLAVPAREERVLVSNGVWMTWSTMMSALLGELLVHGLDVARASRQPWRIGRDEALHVIAGVMAMVPDYLDRERAAGVTASFDLRLRGGPRHLISVADGEAVVGCGSGDCWIVADPVAFLLVGFGRAGQWGQIARGRMLAGGRKPWLATKFGTLITGP